jgi:hypothetical protein
MLVPGNRGRKRAGKFSGEVELFYLEIVRQPLKIKALALAEGLHSQSQWGRRAEDPFRGLRAGPVRYSPLSLSPNGDPEFPFWCSPKHPKNTPDTFEHGESVPENRKTVWREPSIELRLRQRCE